ERLGGIVVKGGLEDTFEDRAYVSDLKWGQARSVMLFTMPYDSSCLSSSQQPTSEPLRLLPSGRPAPADLPVPAPAEPSKPEDFEVSDARVSQEGISDSYSVTYTVKNVSDHRALGTGCLRAHWTDHMQDLEEVTVGGFDLAPHASVTLTEGISFDDDKHWDTVKSLRVFASPNGCADEPDPRNVGFLFSKPSDVGAPRELEEEESEVGNDAGDIAAPENDVAPADEVTE
ncbi:hypothetical protein HPP05_40490, partial [Corallococcus exiguus]|uniref:hypothetical protein n=2 Tax=Corallococcus exiguus TaxID=83462 RepID=UPI0014942F38